MLQLYMLTELAGTANGQTKYTSVLVGDYTNEQCASDFAIRPYIILKNGNDEFVLYGGTLYRSISYVAYQNRNDFTVGSNAYEYIWNLIKAGYGNKYDSEYKKNKFHFPKIKNFEYILIYILTHYN